MFSQRLLTWSALRSNHKLIDRLKGMCGIEGHQLGQLSTFKSNLSLDKMYPDSNLDYLRRNQQNETGDGETFSGHVPVEQLEISYSRSGGPGGQNVNKVNSKVEVRFHIDSASWIPGWIKPRLSEQEQNRITKDGFLIIKSDMTRKQMLNQADCVNKLRNVIYQASLLPKEPTEEELKTKEKRVMKAKANILREKRRRSQENKARSNLLHSDN